MATTTLILADLSLTTVIWWLIVGLIAGFLASMVMRGGGYGIVGDIVVGLVGAFIGGFLASLLGLGGSSGLIGTIIIAFIGACILIAILRMFSRSYPTRRGI
ncbi:MAG TPA: GlsB/YeaQ/YmgE family stress response membrane protein [Ktedonobacteraceae bacterium]|nr:GlsB/YeaQ/YmgE family stress response membrane protein [Ktedonobacteraceae bacterium]